LQVVGDIGQRRAGRAADVDNDLVEVFASDVMPQGQLADATETVDSQIDCIAFTSNLLHATSLCLLDL